MSAVLELDFDGLWKEKDGRTLRWRKVPARDTFAGLRLRLEEKNGQGVEVEFPEATPPEVVISRLEIVWRDFLARFPAPIKQTRAERRGRVPMAGKPGGHAA